MGILWWLADPRMLGWNLTVSKVIAAEVAIFNNFLWNDVWTFRGLGEDRRRWLPRLIRLERV
jgi:dolichol-phosphate mannosyltransferase